MVTNNIDGVGRDVPMAVNEQGGRESAIPFRLDLVDPLAILALGRVLAEGAESHGEWNWTNIPVESHLNHALVHIFAYMAGDDQDEHLDHAFCRLMMAISKQRMKAR